jgi:hypothetical protein
MHGLARRATAADLAQPHHAAAVNPEVAVKLMVAAAVTRAADTAKHN